jgi:hypothetical protein
MALTISHRNPLNAPLGVKERRKLLIILTLLFAGLAIVIGLRGLLL